MRKELIWVGAVGIIFGLIIGFGAWRVNTSTKINKNGLATPGPMQQKGSGQFKIAIDKPENLSVLSSNPVKVSGITSSLSWVTISTDDEDYLTRSLSDGTFSVDVDLSPGVNHIKAVSIDSKGNSYSQNILSVFSSAFQQDQTANESTSEADISKSVALKIAQAERPPMAYLGTVTDIADSTIQIKTTESQIQQIATGKFKVSVTNTRGTANKIVKLTDIAIGDFIVAMGYVNGNEVLDAQRILISDEPTDIQISISLKKVDTVTKKNISLKAEGGDQSTVITPDKNTGFWEFSDGKVKKASLSAFSKSDSVITVLDTSGSPSLTRSLFKIVSE